MVFSKDTFVLRDLMDKKLEHIKAIFLDLDGTIYLGNNLIPGALDFLSRAEEKGIKRFFLSNNSIFCFYGRLTYYFDIWELFGFDIISANRWCVFFAF